MPASKKTEAFANMATIVVTESAMNTLTYKKLETGFNLFEKMAWVIHRIEYVLDDRFNGSGDTLDVALCAGNTRATIADNATFTDPIIMDKVKWIRSDMGTPATALLYTQPQIVKDFTNLPGGGLIVPPSPLYGAAQGTGLYAASTNIIRFFYTVIELSADQYWELVESRRSMTA